MKVLLDTGENGEDGPTGYGGGVVGRGPRRSVFDDQYDEQGAQSVSLFKINLALYVWGIH